MIGCLTNEKKNRLILFTDQYKWLGIAIIGNLLGNNVSTEMPICCNFCNIIVTGWLWMSVKFRSGHNESQNKV